MIIVKKQFTKEQKTYADSMHYRLYLFGLSNKE
jgi:hypothetical protein